MSHGPECAQHERDVNNKVMKKNDLITGCVRTLHVKCKNDTREVLDWE